ncbi:4-hydroxy-2-oxoheptanedioate aldolase [Amycolatopsis sulphurea]|uniref:4-hydroxy-2-oxoheptanedioate aldolase n=1 Tax=Amycolatopsis sulphurea TaxID=76022 RepID=A0A2A9G2U7_9PSEU|nr:4-hydroxy-2-oxoheptanedioate aldolase [Amycolatopsis sulphurea]
MLRVNKVRAKLAAGERVYGLFSVIPEPVLVEMIGCAGYDFVVLDSEHTLVDPQQLENLIRAAEAVDLTPFVRVPVAAPGAILRALDAGAMGVVIPHVRSRSDVDEAIRAARYHPEGLRSLGGGRAPGFGAIDGTGYLARANAEIMVIPLIEDAEGVAAIDDIVAGGGVDLVMPGPADLSQSYGVPWQVRHPLVQEALKRLHTACAGHGVPYCPITRNRDSHRRWLEAGVTAFVLGEERDLAATAFRQHLATVSPRGL